MSPNLFAMLVAVMILVVVVAVAATALLFMRARSEAQVRRRLAPEAEGVADFDEEASAPVLASVARGGKAIEGMVDTEGESARLLVQAGWRAADKRMAWYVFQGLLPVGLGVLVVAGWLTLELPNKQLVMLALTAAAAILSFLLPRWILRGVAAGRQARLKAEMPLFIHLLALLFEAGLSTRQAMASLVREGRGVLPELGRELEVAIRQIDAGADTADALKNLSESLEVDDLATILAILRQVDRYGGEIREPLLEALSVMEERRTLDLREQVNLLSGRMTVVMVLFFFPALLVFVAGPAFLSIIRALGQVNGH